MNEDVNADFPSPPKQQIVLFFNQFKTYFLKSKPLFVLLWFPPRLVVIDNARRSIFENMFSSGGLHNIAASCRLD